MPIKLQPEPAHFYEMVKKPGEKFLKKKPIPTANDWNNHDYWKRIQRDLYHAYSGICAYSCHWIPYDTGSNTVEHFRPKSIYPQEAYYWENYRLVCSRLNGRKGDYEDVLDPFTLQEGWFILDFPSLFVRPGKHLSAADTQSVKRTIERLGLNDEDTCVQMREKFIRDYVTSRVTFSYLERDAPFLASELRRQRLDDRDHPVWEEFRRYGGI